MKACTAAAGSAVAAVTTSRSTISVRRRSAPGEIGLLDTRLGADVFEQRLALAVGLVEQHGLAARLELADAVEQLLLGLRPEALHAADAARLGGRLQIGHGGDAERFMERADPRQREVGNLAQLEDPRRELPAQPFELLAAARLVDLRDRAGQRGADTGQRGQPALGDQGVEIAARTLRAPARPARRRAP